MKKLASLSIADVCALYAFNVSEAEYFTKNLEHIPAQHFTHASKVLYDEILNRMAQFPELQINHVHHV